MSRFTSRWSRVVVSAGLFGLILVGVEFIGRLQPDVTIGESIPEGYLVHSRTTEQDPDVDFVVRHSASLRRIEDTYPEVVVVIRDYPTVWQEKIFSIRLVPPGNTLDLDRGVPRKRLPGVGIGSDAIQCNLDGPTDCREWAYWAHSGTQLVTVKQLRDEGPYMTEAEFRSLVEQILDQQS